MYLPQHIEFCLYANCNAPTRIIRNIDDLKEYHADHVSRTNQQKIAQIKDQFTQQIKNTAPMFTTLEEIYILIDNKLLGIKTTFQSALDVMRSRLKSALKFPYEGTRNLIQALNEQNEEQLSKLEKFIPHLQSLGHLSEQISEFGKQTLNDIQNLEKSLLNFLLGQNLIVDTLSQFKDKSTLIKQLSWSWKQDEGIQIQESKVKQMDKKFHSVFLDPPFSTLDVTQVKIRLSWDKNHPICKGNPNDFSYYYGYVGIQLVDWNIRKNIYSTEKLKNRQQPYEMNMGTYAALWDKAFFHSKQTIERNYPIRWFEDGDTLLLSFNGPHKIFNVRNLSQEGMQQSFEVDFQEAQLKFGIFLCYAWEVEILD